ncbi:hypothetical protein FNV43_RR25250 [Rhamnella rubrinervis]|uniref:Myb-like domain-containing protein n=1 Tax=Rhamnella rubrinervis TaxID=2594499 RepID=A0A8K0DN08_9ROSA|nr:hypothetical protein FNV43_RR25250 [Rhamnella rubrinervis]
MDDQYSLSDLRQLMSSRSDFPSNPRFPEPFPVHLNLSYPSTAYQSHLIGGAVPSGGSVDHNYSITAALTTAVTSTTTPLASSLYGIELESGWNTGINDVGNNSRWPRQETLTLLEIRSRLDSKFKESNQKGPLWDEVSRVMAEEHGYQRSGKKCKEKFENLYKYYKKTKDGKAGRQDGKHYRFFRQLEAIYGENNNKNDSNQFSSALETHNHAGRYPLLNYRTATAPNQPFNQESQEVVHGHKFSESQLSFSNNSTTEFETSSSENNDDDLSAVAAFKVSQSMMGMGIKPKGTNNERQSCSRVRKRWKTKVENFVDSQMRKVIEAQENWMDKMLKSIMDKEEERMSREEERRRREAARFDREVIEFWAKEKAWAEARDAAFVEALKNFKGKGVENIAGHDDDKNCYNHGWTEEEIECLIEIRTSLEQTFEESGYLKAELTWVDIAQKLTSFGYERSAAECEEKWENLNTKCKEELKTSSNYFVKDDQVCCNMGTQMHPHCYLLIGEGENLWVDKYGVKHSKEMDQPISNKQD